MIFKEKILIKDENPEHLINIFHPEEKSLRTKRFSYRIQKQADGLSFALEAKDKTAFRTVKTSIKKLINVYKKTRAIK